MTVRPAAPRRTGARLGTILVLATSLAGCNIASRMANLGGPPDLTPVQNPTASPDYRPVTMPMPTVAPAVQQANSLWRAGARAFFKDQRAGKVGDILTVVVNIQDSGAISNQTARTRAAGEDAAASAFLGYQASAHKFLPTAVDPGNLVNVESSSSHTGNGTVTRNETITMRVAAVVTQVLPNGNLAISGRQEVRINFEVRELEVAGVIRPEDIAANNTVT